MCFHTRHTLDESDVMNDIVSLCKPSDSHFIVRQYKLFILIFKELYIRICKCVVMKRGITCRIPNCMDESAIIYNLLMIFTTSDILSGISL